MATLLSLPKALPSVYDCDDEVGRLPRFWRGVIRHREPMEHMFSFYVRRLTSNTLLLTSLHETNYIRVKDIPRSARYNELHIRPDQRLEIRRHWVQTWIR